MTCIILTILLTLKKTQHQGHFQDYNTAIINPQTNKHRQDITIYLPYNKKNINRSHMATSIPVNLCVVKLDFWCNGVRDVFLLISFTAFCFCIIYNAANHALCYSRIHLFQLKPQSLCASILWDCDSESQKSFQPFKPFPAICKSSHSGPPGLTWYKFGKEVALNKLQLVTVFILIHLYR